MQEEDEEDEDDESFTADEDDSEASSEVLNAATDKRFVLCQWQKSLTL